MIMSKYITIKGKSYVEASYYDKLLCELKHSNDKIAELEDKINNVRARCHKSAIDAFNNGTYCALRIVTADELKNDDKAKELKYELDKTYNQLMEVEKDAQEKIAKLEKTRSSWVDNAVEWREKFEKAENKIRELESELEVKDNLLKIKNGLCKSPMMTVVVAKTINGQDYVRLEDFMSVVNDLQNYDLYHAE